MAFPKPLQSKIEIVLESVHVFGPVAGQCTARTERGVVSLFGTAVPSSSSPFRLLLVGVATQAGASKNTVP